ncbi:MAG: GntR family transcriptional regulator [Desulfobacterales bacterium]|nr:GntR family transcriptional regulator [Desulfobacterales bacterium]
MDKKPAKASSEEIAYAEILKLIYERKFKPGDFLQENLLSEMLGMSRTPINRALSRMNFEGILERKKKKGCYIPFVDPRDGQQLFSLRKLIEGQVAWEAAHACTAEDLDKLMQINAMDQRALDKKDEDIYYSANRDFHFTLAESIGNRHLERITKQLFKQTLIYIFFFDNFYRRPLEYKIETPVQHRTILECIEKKDARGAREAMEGHIAHTMLMFER